MPSCVIKNCLSKTGRKGQAETIRLHPFPTNPNRIKLWLLQTGQSFDNLEEMVKTIVEDNKSKKYRMCSLHFCEESYKATKLGKTLKKDAIPTVFSSVPDSEFLIEQNLRKKRKQKRKRTRTTVTSSNDKSGLLYENVQESCTDYSGDTVEGKVSVYTQTDFNLENSVVIQIKNQDHNYHAIQSHGSSFGSPTKNYNRQSGKEITSTPIQVGISDFESPLKKKQMLDEDHEALFLPVEENYDTLSPMTNLFVPVEDYSSISLDEQIYEEKDEDYQPEEISLTDSDFDGFASILYTEEPQKSPEMRELTEAEIVQDRKFIVFECCLDNLIRKVKCQYSADCNYLVSTFSKSIEGSSVRIKGKCYQGHLFTIFESQPKIGRYCSGNIMLASSILFSGLNFQKVKEFVDIFGMVSISEKSYYRYQSKFLFPAIDLAWKEAQSRNFEELKNVPLCISGDGQCDSPGHNAKYCTYTVMDNMTEKIIDFEVVQRTQCSSSVAMEKYAFEICMDRLLSKGYKIRIFASDRHVGIRKKMRQDYSDIKHQFDVWHYAKSIRKKLTAASKQKFCKEITPWIDKIVLHFWWSIQTCGDNVENLKERWISLLHHVTDIHEWDSEIYNRCGHSPLTHDKEEEKVLWLDPENQAFLSIQKIVSNQTLLDDLKHLVNNCHTGKLENFHNLVLKYRTKRIHFMIDAMEARTKLAALTHNYNIGRELATVKFPKRNTEPKGTVRTKLFVPKTQKRWLVKNVYEKMDVKYLEEVSIKVLNLVNHKLNSGWTSRTPTLPPNIANIERPNKEEIKKKQIMRFRNISTTITD